MNFERGKDPKEALRIGIREKIYREIEEIVQEHSLSIFSSDVREKMEKKFKERTGISVKIEWNGEKAELNFDILMPIQKIETAFTIEAIREKRP
jgi:hypothetical protein